jgi:hypothetical protein
VPLGTGADRGGEGPDQHHARTADRSRYLHQLNLAGLTVLDELAHC